MNREIIFRAKCSGVWRYGNYVHLDKKPIHSCYNSEYRDVIVVNGVYGEHYYPITELSSLGQYTGLKDKNGNKIFEGDMLFQELGFLGVVCMSKRYGVSIMKKTITWSLIHFVLDSDFDAGVLSDIEIRGNIYDSSELMK